jgi:hypothetical protein
MKITAQPQYVIYAVNAYMQGISNLCQLMMWLSKQNPAVKSGGIYNSNPYSLNVIPVISPVVGSSTITLVNWFHTTVIRMTILDYNYLSLEFQHAACEAKIQTLPHDQQHSMTYFHFL